MKKILTELGVKMELKLEKIEGRQEKAVESAKIFLEMKVLSTEQIAKGTGLSIQEVEKLAEEINA